MRVALGACARALLRELGVRVGSYVLQIGQSHAVRADDVPQAASLLERDAEALALLADLTPTRALTPEASQRLEQAVDDARSKRDTLGGIVEVVVSGLPVGLGSYVQADRKLDGRLARALLATQAVKAVELGDGWAAASALGSEVHDPIFLGTLGLSRPRQRSGGLEAGVTTGIPLRLRVAMKPIATVPAALPSVDLQSLTQTTAHVERSDTCAVPALGVICEAVVALELADAAWFEY